MIWGRLQNGYYRSFHPDPMPASEVPEVERYAVQNRYNAVVNLDGARYFPTEVLVLHYCREYRDERLMGGVKGLDELIDLMWKE